MSHSTPDLPQSKQEQVRALNKEAAKAYRRRRKVGMTDLELKRLRELKRLNIQRYRAKKRSQRLPRFSFMLIFFFFSNLSTPLLAFCDIFF